MSNSFNCTAASIKLLLLLRSFYCFNSVSPVSLFLWSLYCFLKASTTSKMFIISAALLFKCYTVSSAVVIVMPTLVHMPAYIVLLLKNKGKQRKQRKTNMKNKSKEYKFLLLYAISGASDCLCSASTASATWSEQQQLQWPVDRLLPKPVKTKTLKQLFFRLAKKYCSEHPNMCIIHTVCISFTYLFCYISDWTK